MPIQYGFPSLSVASLMFMEHLSLFFQTELNNRDLKYFSPLQRLHQGQLS